MEFGKEIRRRFDRPIAQTAGRGDAVELTLPQPAKIDHAIVMEDIEQGERIREYQVEGLVGPGTWRTLAGGQSIGHKRIEQFEPVEVAKIRLRVQKSVAEPLIRMFAVTQANG